MYSIDRLNYLENIPSDVKTYSVNWEILYFMKLEGLWSSLTNLNTKSYHEAVAFGQNLTTLFQEDQFSCCAPIHLSLIFIIHVEWYWFDRQEKIHCCPNSHINRFCFSWVLPLPCQRNLEGPVPSNERW